MHLKRSLGLAALVLVAAAILIATAGAARGPQKAQRQFHFTSTASVFKYLKAHGIDTRGIVVQRGKHNYAGPNCPGKRWNCTRARHVIQYTTAADASNSFVCSPATTGTTPPNDCVIVQAAPVSGDNNAKCIETSTAASVTQNCSISQDNVGGNNNAIVIQLISQGGQTPVANQNADVTQTNGTGKNSLALTQTILQSAATNGPTVNQNQNGHQNNSISQTSASGGQLSVMAQTVAQKETAGKVDRDRDSSFTPFAASTLTGSQTQLGDGVSDTYQNSTGVSKSFNFQNMLQTESAPRFSAVTQSQNGPFRCCSPQTSNTSDVFNIQQSKTQLTSSSTASQFLDENGFLDTSGTGHIGQFANQNGATQSNTCDVTGNACSAETTGNNGSFTTCSISGGDGFCGGDFALSAASAGKATALPNKSVRARQPLRVHHF